MASQSPRGPGQAGARRSSHSGVAGWWAGGPADGQHQLFPEGPASYPSHQLPADFGFLFFSPPTGWLPVFPILPADTPSHCTSCPALQLGAQSPEPRAVCKQPTLHPGPAAQITPSRYLCADLLSPRHKPCLFLFEAPLTELPTRRTGTSKILKHLMNLNFLESLRVTSMRTIPGWRVVPRRYGLSSAPATSPLGWYSREH